MKIDGGATLWAKQTVESKIFTDKPDKWFKIWFYLVTKASHKDNKQFKKGTCFTKYEWITEATKATRNEIDHCLRWLKSATMIATRKATRGFVVDVLKYNIYQSLQNYRSDTKSDPIGDTEATQKRYKSDTELAFQKLPQEITKGTDNLITLYKEKFAGHIKRWGISTVIKMRNLIEGTYLEGIPLEVIKERISKATRGTPWYIISEKWIQRYKDTKIQEQKLQKIQKVEFKKEGKDKVKELIKITKSKTGGKL